MEGIKKLETQVLELNDYNVSGIFEYLKTRKDLYDKFNNDEKTIKEMYNFICNKARSMAKNNVAMINDRVVYLWATTYFNKSNEELGITKKTTNNITPTETKTENKTLEEKKNNTEQISIFEEVQK